MISGHLCAISGRVQPSCRARLYVLLGYVLFFLSAHVTNAATTFEDISSQVSVTRSGLVLNRVTNTFDCLVQVTNTSAAILSGPLVLSVSSISTTNVTLFNPAGQDASGNPYINLAVPTGGLASGQTIANSLLKFKNPSRVAFTFSIAVLSQAPSTNGGTTIQDATGGTIAVPDPDNPNAMITIVIPPGVLGVTSDVISVSFSSTSPGPLRPSAVAAGAHFVSSVLTLTRASGLQFLQPIQITIPYILNQVGPNDSLLVLYWDTNENAYDVVAKTGMDRIKGTITIQTIHFSQYQALALPISIGPSGLPNDPADLIGDTAFRANPDGFPIENFTSMTGGTSDGACASLTAFAKWYYDTQSSLGPGPELVNSAIFNKGKLGQNTGQAAEDDVDQELAYSIFTQTLPANRAAVQWLPKQAISDFDTANDLFLSLLVLNRPQLIVMAVSGSYKAPSGGFHSLLVYNYVIDRANYIVHFGFYDPNFPLQEQVLDYQISAKSFFQPAYTNKSNPPTSFSWVYFNPLSSFIPTSVLREAFTSATNGWPNRNFKEILIDDTKSTGINLSSPEGPDPVTNPAEYQVLPGNSTLAMNWTCSCPPTGISTVYAHIFINGVFKTDIPIQPAPPGTNTPFSYAIPSDIITSSHPELIVIISEFPNDGSISNSIGLDAIDYLLSFGYEGFLRIKLIPPLYQVTQMTYGGQAYTSNYPNGDSPYQYNVAGDDGICYPPSVLASLYSYINPSSFRPYSAVLPLACVGYNQVVSYPLQVISPLFSDTLSTSLGGPSGAASASTDFNIQVTPNSVSLSANGFALSSDLTLVARSTGGANLSLVVPSQAHYQVTAQVSPTSTGACGLIVAGMSVRDPNNPGGTLQNNTAYAGSQFPPYANPSVSFTGSFPLTFNTVDIGVGFNCTVDPVNAGPPVQVSVTMTLMP